MGKVTAGADANLVRARNEDGTFKADDPATPSADEAWVSVSDNATATEDPNV